MSPASGGPPGVFGVARRLARLSARRRLNRFASRQKSKKKGKGRAAVGRKEGGGFSPLVWLFGLLMLLQSFLLSTQLLVGHAREIESRARAAREATEPRTEEERGKAEGTKARRQIYLGTKLRRLPTWPAPEREAPFFRGIALVLTVLFCGIFSIHMSSGNRDLGQAGWDLEWLFTFPVPAKGLFLAKLGEYVLTDFVLWLTFFPLLTVVYWRSGFGAFGIPLSIAGTFGVGMIMGALRLTTETVLRKRLARPQLKNIQALFTVLGLLLLFGTLSLAVNPPGWFFDAAAWLPDAILGLPWASPLLLAVVVPGVLVLIVWVASITAGALSFTSHTVADGLLVSGGSAYGGTRQRAPGPALTSGGGRFRGLVGKEIRLLLRDRNLLVQMLVVPLLIVGVQFMMNPSLRVAGASPDTAVVMAYGIGAYVLMFGGFSVLYVEKESLWLLFTLPHRLGDLLRQKVVLWALAASLYAVGALAFAWRPDGAVTLRLLFLPVLALAGVWTMSYVAAGLGALGTDPFAQDAGRRVSPQWIYAYFLVAGAFGASLLAPSLWTPIVLLALSAALAWAIWQKVEVRLPVLLDPVMKPAPELTVATGLVAVFAFFVLQALFALVFGLMAPGALAVLLAYALAGFLVGAVGAMAVSNVPRWREALGLKGAASARRALPAALGAALLAGAVGVGWTLLIRHVDAFQELRDAAPRLMDPSGEDGWAIVVLIVVAAPLFEEFIFRGLLFGGMRRSLAARPAILACALLFAIVHPPLSFVPVLGLGIAAGWVRERTGSLPAAVLTHALYNGIVVLAAVL